MSMLSLEEFSMHVHDDLIRMEPDRKKAEDYFVTDAAKDVIRSGYSDYFGKY